MDYKMIKDLLETYFEGETTLEEEAKLKDYFLQDEVDPKLKEYQSLFQFFSFEKKQQLDDSFETQLIEKIQEQQTQIPKLRPLWPRLSRIAAAIALLIGVWWAYSHYAAPETPKQQAIDWSMYEPDTPEEALKITRAALKTASSQLNNGTVKAMSEFNKIEQVGKIFK